LCPAKGSRALCPHPQLAWVYAGSRPPHARIALASTAASRFCGGGGAVHHREGMQGVPRRAGLLAQRGTCPVASRLLAQHALPSARSRRIWLIGCGPTLADAPSATRGRCCATDWEMDGDGRRELPQAFQCAESSWTTSGTARRARARSETRLALVAHARADAVRSREWRGAPAAARDDDGHAPARE
jgi:hypothetical protein